jgi:hypothetical protein
MPEIECLATGEVRIGYTTRTPGGSAARPRRLMRSRFLRRFHDPTRLLTRSGGLTPPARESGILRECVGVGPIVIGRAATT